jgi:hypothetical protein
VVVPATVDEEVEAIDGDYVRQRVLVVHSAQRSHLHRRPHVYLSLSPAKAVGGEAAGRPRFKCYLKAVKCVYSRSFLYGVVLSSFVQVGFVAGSRDNRSRPCGKPLEGKFKGKFIKKKNRFTPTPPPPPPPPRLLNLRRRESGRERRRGKKKKEFCEIERKRVLFGKTILPNKCLLLPFFCNFKKMEK